MTRSSLTSADAGDANVVPFPGPTTDATAPGTGGRGATALAVLLAACVAGSALFGALYPAREWGLLGLALAALVIALALTRPAPLPRPGLVAMLGLTALCLLAAVSMLWAESVDRAWTEANRLALYSLTLGAALVLTRRPRAALGALATVAAAVGVVVAVILFRMLSGDGAGLFVDFRLYEPLGYTNGMAGLLLVGFWPLLALGERASRVWLRGVALGGASLVAGLLVLTQARAAPAALAVAVTVALVLVPGRLRRAWALIFALAGAALTLPWTLAVYEDRGPGAVAPSDGALTGAALALLLAAGVVGVAWALVARVVPGPRARRALAVAAVLVPLVGAGVAFVSVDGPVDQVRSQYRAFVDLQVNEQAANRFTDAGGYRYDLWRVAMLEWRAHRLLGLGAGNYATEYFELRRSPQYVRQPHSLELQLLAELGIGGGLLLAVVVLAALWGLAAAGRAGAAGGPRLGVVVAGAGASAAWFAHTSVDWLYNLPGVTATMLVLLGAGLNQRSPAPPAGAPGRARRPVLAAVVIVAALAAASIGRQVAADRYRTSAERQLPADPAAALAAADKALALGGGSMEAWYAKAAAHARLGRYGLARGALLEAARREPSNYVPWALLGDLDVRRGRLAAAAGAYGRAGRLNPFEPGLRDLAADPARATERLR